MLPLKAGDSPRRHASSVSGTGNQGTHRGGVLCVAGTYAQRYARKIMSQSARSGRVPAPSLRTNGRTSSALQAQPAASRLPDVAIDVLSGTAAHTTACSFAGTRRVMADPTTVCSTCVDPNAHRLARHPFGCSAKGGRAKRNLLKNDHSVSAGAAAAGSLGAIAEGTAHFAREWSAQDAAGWAMTLTGAMSATDTTQNRKGTSTRNGSCARNAPLDTCTSNAQDVEQRYVARAARAAKGAISKNVTNAV